MGYTFISYSRKDAAFVQMLVSSLRRQGFEYWFDMEHIQPGDLWRRVLHEAVTNAARMIVVISDHSMASDEVMAEWDYALYLKISVIPLYLRDCEMNYRLRDLNYIDFRGSYQSGIDVLLPALKQAPVRAPTVSVKNTPEYVEDATDRNWMIRCHAVDRLIDLGAGMLGGAGLVALITALDDSDLVVAERAAEGLQQSSVKEARDALQEFGFRRESKGGKQGATEPFRPDWIRIPAGSVTLEAGGYLKEPTRFYVPQFYIAKYPVTNAQYIVFMISGGYRERRWWTDEGWRLRKKEGWEQPRYWEDRKGQMDHPVVGVSWYEALAFCQWLSEFTEQPLGLPTEQQWQRGAQGDDGREYPWGNEMPNDRLCNLNLGRTTPVTQYPAGASPFGVMDMIGNVWEWCQTGGESGTSESDGTEERVLRGGPWLFLHPTRLRVADRSRRPPHYCLNRGGFRVAHL